MNPNKNNYKENLPRHFRVKLLKTKYKKKLLKVIPSSQKENTFKAVKIRISDDFLTQTVEYRKKIIYFKYA